MTVTDAPPAGPGSRPCSQCQSYVVGPENGWLCYRCGFDEPLPIESVAHNMPKLEE